MLSRGPACIDRTASHATARLRVAGRLVAVSGYPEPDGEGEPVVDERSAGSPAQRRQADEEHDDARAEQHEDRATGQAGVQFLAGVELPHLAGDVASGPGAQPAPIRPREPVEP